MLPDCLKIILPQSWKHCKQHPHSEKVSRFTVTQILGELNFGESRRSKTASLAIFNRDQRSIAVHEITWFQSIGQLWNISVKEYKCKGI